MKENIVFLYKSLIHDHYNQLYLTIKNESNDYYLMDLIG